MSDATDNVTPLRPTVPIFSIRPDEAVPMDRQALEIVGILEELLVLAREGRLRALGAAVVTVAAPPATGERTEQLTATRYTAEAPEYNYALYAAARRLFLRLERDTII